MFVCVKGSRMLAVSSKLLFYCFKAHRKTKNLTILHKDSLNEDVGRMTLSNNAEIVKNKAQSILMRMIKEFNNERMTFFVFWVSFLVLWGY